MKMNEERAAKLELIMGQVRSFNAGNNPNVEKKIADILCMPRKLAIETNDFVKAQIEMFKDN